MDNVTNKGHIPIGNQSSDDRFWETSVRSVSYTHLTLPTICSV